MEPRLVLPYTPPPFEQLETLVLTFHTFREAQEWTHHWVRVLPEAAALRHFVRSVEQAKAGKFPIRREESAKCLELLERTVSRLRAAIDRAAQGAEEKENAHRARVGETLARMRRERLEDPRDHDEEKGNA